MSDLDTMTKKIIAFRDARDWKQFHNPKDLAIALQSEATEVLDEFKWKNPQEIEKYLKKNKSKVADELVDVLYWVLLMSHDLDIDLIQAFEKKMQENDKKYPVQKARGKADKYTKYQK